MASRDTNQLIKTRPKFYYGYVIVAVTFTIMLLSQGLFIAFGLFFDPLLVEFGWTRAMISGAYSLSSILGGALGIVMGWLTDKFGPRLVVTLCGFCLGLGYIMISQVNSLWQFYLFYGVIVGIGMSGLWVPLLSPIVRWFEGKRSLMTAIVLTGLTVGQFIAPLVISRLIAAHGWRLSYIILGGAVMLIIVIAAQFMRRSPKQPGQIPDRTETGKIQELQSAVDDFTLKEAARTTQFWLVVAMFFCVGFSAFSIIIHIVPHTTLLGISAVTAAYILAISGLIGIFGNFVLGGVIGDRLGNRKAFIIGSVLVAASIFWLVPAGEIWMLYLFAVVFGIGLGGMGTSESPLIAGLFGPSSHGLIYGVVGLSWTTGGAVGPFVTGYMCDVIGDYQMAFLLCAVIGVLSLILLLILRPTKRRMITL